MRTAPLISEVTFPALVHHDCVIGHPFDNDDDATLVALARLGQREALEPLLLRHYASVLGLCSGCSAPRPTPRTWRRRRCSRLCCTSPSSPMGHASAWLHAIAANGARMRLRDRVASFDALAPGTRSTVLWIHASSTPEEWALLTPIWWAWLLKGVCHELVANSPDDGWTLRLLLRRSPLVSADAAPGL